MEQKALIIYHSKRGTTKFFAKKIGEFLTKNSFSVNLLPIENFKPENIENIDLLLLGCWTSGYIFFGQKPDVYWYNFSKQLPDLKDLKIGLFATYKIATGSMYKNMLKNLQTKNVEIPFLKSRNGNLDEITISKLKAILGN